MSRVKNTYNALKDVFTEALADGIKVWTTSRKTYDLLGDIYGFGLDGGPYDSKKAREIVIQGDDIIGLRTYDTESEEPLERLDQITGFDENGRITGYTSGKLVELSLDLYDTDFTEWGSAKRLTNGDHVDLEDTNRIHVEFINDALRYYVNKGRLKGKDIGNNIYVIDIPTTKPFRTIMEELITSGNFKRAYKDMKDGFDWGLSKYFITQTIAYKIFDSLIFDPFIEKPLKKLKEKGGEKAKRLLDPFILSQYKVITGMINALYGLPAKDYVVYGRQA